jgi:sarcosine oxidase
VRREAGVVVVGGGVTGAAALRSLARAGMDTVLLEQFELGHTRGSSHGTSRIFRLAYAEERWVRLAQTALRGWRELESEVGERLLLPTGSLDIGDTASANARALAECDIGFELLDGAAVTRRWGLGLAAEERALYQQDGAVLRADLAHRALIASAQARGAEVIERTRVLAIGADGAVSTHAGELRAQAVVVAAGPWAATLLEPLDIDLPVTVTRETLAYFATEETRLPTMIDDVGAAGVRLGGGRTARWFYSLVAPGVGLKAGLHQAGPESDPEQEGELDEGIVAGTAEWVSRRLPMADPEPLRAETCLYTSTEDERFIVERRGPVVVCSACSGHGFKFAPTLGQRLKELVEDALAH